MVENLFAGLMERCRDRQTRGLGISNLRVEDDQQPERDASLNPARYLSSTEF